MLKKELVEFADVLLNYAEEDWPEFLNFLDDKGYAGDDVDVFAEEGAKAIRDELGKVK